MFPQIPQLTTPAPSSGTSLPLQGSKTDPARLGHTVTGVIQPTNFAAAFAADAVDLPNADADTPDESNDLAEQKSTDTNAATQKEAHGLADPKRSDEGLALTIPKPSTSDAPLSKPLLDQTNSTLAHNPQDPLLSGHNPGMPNQANKTVTDPWQVVVLPKGEATLESMGPTKSLNMSSVPNQPPDESFAATFGSNMQTPGAVPTNLSGSPALESEQHATLPPPIEPRLVAGEPETASTPETKLTARFAELAAPHSRQVSPMPPHSMAKTSTTPQMAVVETDKVGTPGTTAILHAALTEATGSDDATTVLKSKGPVPTVVSGEAIPKTTSKGQLTQPPVDQTIATTPVLNSTRAADLSPATNAIGLPPLETTKVATSEHDKRKLARSEPTLQNPPISPIENTKLTAPMVPWQGMAPTLLETTTTAEPFAFDPISSESRLSALSSNPTTSNPLQRTDLPPQIARQLAEAIQQNPNRLVEITLKPQELGAVRLSVQQAEAGIIVSLTAERPETLDLMRRHVDQLEQDFQAMGYANIAFSFADSDAGTDAQSDAPPSSGPAEAEDVTATPATHIHLSNGTTSGVDLRL